MLHRQPGILNLFGRVFVLERHPIGVHALNQFPKPLQPDVSGLRVVVLRPTRPTKANLRLLAPRIEQCTPLDTSLRVGYQVRRAWATLRSRPKELRQLSYWA